MRTFAILFAALLTAVSLAGLFACAGPQPGLGSAAGVIRAEAIARSPGLTGSTLQVDGRLLGGPESCACLKVCDENDENCTDCFCDPEGCGSCEDAVAGPEPSPFTNISINTGPLKVKLDELNSPEACTDPRPEDQGCTTLCKPCLTFVCVDGEWEAFPVDTPEGICDPIDSGSPRPNGCPRGDTGFCPAECSFCF